MFFLWSRLSFRFLNEIGATLPPAAPPSRLIPSPRVSSSPAEDMDGVDLSLKCSVRSLWSVTPDLFFSSFRGAWKSYTADV